MGIVNRGEGNQGRDGYATMRKVTPYIQLVSQSAAGIAFCGKDGDSDETAQRTCPIEKTNSPFFATFMLFMSLLSLSAYGIIS